MDSVSSRSCRLSRYRESLKERQICHQEEKAKAMGPYHKKGITKEQVADAETCISLAIQLRDTISSYMDEHAAKTAGSL
jgi:hypothetical protein